MIQQKLDDDFLQRRGSESGFSMIEMLIAMVVITFGLVSIVGISAYVSRANSISATLNVLAAAAQDQVDRLRTARWTPTSVDPMLTVGGSVPSVSSALGAERYASEMTKAYTASLWASPITSTPTPAPVAETYTYTLDPDNPHHATASGTPVGDLNIRWEVRQGATADVRYVTIKVVQVNAPPNLANGFTVTTVIVRN
jgi:prepilin-type N-terminal cleavage/methylation domain-containing protein